MADSHKIKFEPVNLEMEVGEDREPCSTQRSGRASPDARMPGGAVFGLQVAS